MNKIKWILLCIIILHILLIYQKYRNFIDYGEHFVSGELVLDYNKTSNNKKFRIFKISSDDFNFYTNANKKDKITIGDKIAILINPIGVNFIDYLKSNFYLRSFAKYKIDENVNKKIYEIYNINTNFKYEENFINTTIKNKRKNLENFIDRQHKNKEISSFYKTLFLAKNLDNNIKQKISILGVNHLIAISGYHFGFIMAIIFLIFSPVYKFFSQRFFPYRNYKFDISIIGFTILLFYFLILGFVPSFFRAYLMAIFIFFVICRGINLFKFQILSFITLLAIAIRPNLIFNLAFLFSVSGVFYIFLYLKYFKNKSLIFNSIFLNIFVFFSMHNLVLYFFPLISIGQLSNIILNYLFIVFYPFSFLAHIIKQGHIFDNYLEMLFNINFGYKNLIIPSFVFYSQIIISFLAIRFKILFYLLPITGIISFFI